MYRIAVRTAPLVASVADLVTRCNSSVRIIASATITNTYDAASTVKHQPYPTVTTRTPASAGPKIRDAFTIAL